MCASIVCWFPFFFLRSLSVQYLPSTPLTEQLRRRRYEERFDRRNNQITEVARSSEYREREDVPPAYHELPSPPAYTKVNVTDEHIAVAIQEEHDQSETNHDHLSVIANESSSNPVSQTPLQHNF